MISLAEIRRKIDHRGLAFALGAYALFLGVFWAHAGMSALHASSPHAAMTLETYSARVPFQLLLAAAVLGLVTFAGWQRRIRLVSPSSWDGTLWLMPSFLLMALVGSIALVSPKPDFPPSVEIVVRAVLFFGLVGIFEEILFRGILMAGLEARLGPVIALFLSAALFGATHLINYLIEGQPLEATLAQMAHATASGVLYGAIVLRTGNIWPAIILHASWDKAIAFSAAAIKGTGNAATGSDTGSILFALFFFCFDILIGLLVLRSWYRQKRAPG